MNPRGSSPARGYNCAKCPHIRKPTRTVRSTLSQAGRRSSKMFTPNQNGGGVGWPPSLIKRIIDWTRQEGIDSLVLHANDSALSPRPKCDLTASDNRQSGSD